MVLLLPGGCSKSERTAGARAPADSVARTVSAFQVPASEAGRLVLAGGRLRFVPCGASGPGTPVADLPDSEGTKLVRSFRQGDGDIPAMVHVSGGRLAYIRYAAPERSCDGLPPEGELVARGNEPFWSVEVDGDSAILRMPLEPGGVRFDHGAWRRLAGGEWAYEARRDQGGAPEFLELHLAETRCYDSMSGARYPFRAALIREGNPATGCAIEGRRARRG